MVIVWHVRFHISCIRAEECMARMRVVVRDTACWCVRSRKMSRVRARGGAKRNEVCGIEGKYVRSEGRRVCKSGFV